MAEPRPPARRNDLISKLLGRPPSDRYAGLSYVTIALRLISFLLFGFGLFIAIWGIFARTSMGIGDMLSGFLVGLYIGVGGVLAYGGSELIHVMLDIEKNTRNERGAS